MHVHLSRPDITSREWEAVKEVLFSGVLSLGPKTKAFEEECASYVGTKFAVAVSSGTAGLHLLLHSLGVGKGDEVITTPFSFVASSNCILLEGATPVFVDIDPNTLNINPTLIPSKITAKTKALLPVDVFGHPAKIDAILELAAQYQLPVIEDACEALGAEINGKKAGSFGNGGVFAFYPNKQITTGEGGIIVTNSEEIARLCISLRNQGRGQNQKWLEHERLGFNYRMNEMSAALGLAQLQRIDEILAKRNRVAQMYKERLNQLKDVILPFVDTGVKISWFVFVIRLDERINRDELMKSLLRQGVECRPYFPSIHLLDFYRKTFGYQPGSFPEAEKASRSTLALPFYNNLTEREIDYVVEVLKKSINNLFPRQYF